MQAARLTAIKALTIENAPMPTPGPDEVLVRVAHCALCRTDAKMLSMGHRDLVTPRILGHEIYGKIDASGEPVVVWPGIACGECVQCCKGTTNLCQDMRVIGFHQDGGLAEYLVVPQKSLISVPDGLPGHIACLAEPLACGLNALGQLSLAPGETLLILGAGPVGLLMALAAFALEAKPAIQDLHPDKQQRTRSFRRQIHAGWSDPADKHRFDAAVNAAPATSAFIDGVKGLSDGGRFCLFSGLTDGKTIDAAFLNEIHYRQLSIVGAYGCTASQMADALTILSDHSSAAEWLIEDRVSLADVPSVLPELLYGNRFKIIVDIDHP